MSEVNGSVQLERIMKDDPKLEDKLRHIIAAHIKYTGTSLEEAILEHMNKLDFYTSHQEEDAGDNRAPQPADEELLALIGGGANLYQQAEGLNRNSWFVSLLEKYLSLEINEE